MKMAGKNRLVVGFFQHILTNGCPNDVRLVELRTPVANPPRCGSAWSRREPFESHFGALRFEFDRLLVEAAAAGTAAGELNRSTEKHDAEQTGHRNGFADVVA